MTSRLGLPAFPRLATLATLAAMVLTACQAAPADGPSAIGASRYRPLLLNSSDLGPTPRSEAVSVTLELFAGTPGALEAAAQSIYDPSSPDYLKFLDAKALNQRFGPPPGAVGSVTMDLQAAGLTAQSNPGSVFVTASGPAPAVARLFRVGIHDFRSKKGVLFHAGLADPVVPTGLRPLVKAVEPISSYQSRHNSFIPVGGLKPVDVALAYGAKALRDQGIDGTGETVEIYALGDGFSQKELDIFSDKFSLPRITPKIIDGPLDAAPGGEMMMDIEVVHAIAPGAQIHISTTKTNDTGSIFEKLIADGGSIWTNSWGYCELGGGDPAERSALEKAAAAGITAFQSTGDSAAYRCLDTDWGAPPADKHIAVEYPAAFPNGVTAVGGTRIGVRQDGTYLDEVVWSEPLATQGSGGGISRDENQPSWQRGPGVSNNSQNPKNHRMLPDVVADADPDTGMAIYLEGAWSQGGGTSQAAPMWAGFTALMNAYLVKKGLKRIGFINPALYDLAAGKPPFPPFHDVTLGTNLVYSAGPGFDIATGLGSPDVWNLARDLEAYQRNGGKP